MRRSVYALVDRQYLPGVYNVFDFANPDLHTSQRAETTSPQQALFALNSTYVADRARKIAARIQAEATPSTHRIAQAYQTILGREPTPHEMQAAARFLAAASAESSNDTIAAGSKAWSYGYGDVEVTTGELRSVNLLPHFTGDAWQGGNLWPDNVLGWAQLTANGGHPGNDHEHAVVRRWTARSRGTISIRSEVLHQESSGDGIYCWITTSRDGVLKSARIHNSRKKLDIESIAVDKGDTVDFVVDVGKNLNNDQFIWAPTIVETDDEAKGGSSAARQKYTAWNAQDDFPRVQLSPLEQFTQLLLISNELMFVD
jgi:hypothetical protein